jgi:hypothetical protein
VFVRFAVGVGTAGHVVAWIDAAALHAGQVILALVVRRALLLGHGGTRAANAVRVAGHAPGTFADVAALGVEAVGPAAARVVAALVHVDAAVLWVALVAGLAHALGRVGRRALCVYSAGEAVAWICGQGTRGDSVIFQAFQFSIIISILYKLHTLLQRAVNNARFNS